MVCKYYVFLYDTKQQARCVHAKLDAALHNRLISSCVAGFLCVIYCALCYRIEAVVTSVMS